MPFALVTIGLLMIITGAKDTYAQFGKQVAGDFTGDKNFTWWLVSLGAVGSLGYIDQLRVFSRTFMTLIIIVMLLSNGGFFAQFTKALQAGPIAPTPANSGALGSQPFTGPAANTAEANALRAANGPQSTEQTAQQNVSTILNFASKLNPVTAFLSTLFGSSPAF